MPGPHRSARRDRRRATRPDSVLFRAPTLTPLLYGSAGSLVTAIHDQDGKRAILDGGFTRLFCNRDTAGTARYVKNAAAWLVNVERFRAEKPPVQAPEKAPAGK